MSYLRDLHKASFNQIQHLFIDRSNILWLGTSNKGVFKMDLENTSFSNSIDFTRNSKTYSSKFKNHPIQAMTVNVVDTSVPVTYFVKACDVLAHNHQV